ncbi:hypothetical protein LCGC14_0441260 [marine sediment metagenome]|uniref:Phage gp6-like head-tail connector protein n=1 Tax=marine sediment metagenome TaxID=412755 RepID=A0A0F9SR81_9ZZZZ
MADYVTLVEVKNHISLEQDSTEQDTKLTAMIKQAQKAIETWTGTWWDARTKTIQTEATHRRQIKLFMPARIISLTSVTDGVEGGTQTGTVILAADLRVYETYIERSGRVFWSDEQLDIEVVGSFGYTVVPDDIKVLTLETIGILAAMKQKSFTQDDGVERTVLLNALPTWVKEIIQSRRMHNFVNQPWLITPVE